MKQTSGDTPPSAQNEIQPFAPKSRIGILSLIFLLIFILISVMLYVQHRFFITVNQLQTEYRVLDKQTQDMQAAVLQQGQQIAKQEHTENFWLAETTDLIRLAYIHSLSDHQSDPMLILLIEAEQTLKHVTEINVQSLRTELSKHIEKLQKTPFPDFSKLVALIQSMDSRLEALPLLIDEIRNSSQNLQATPAPSLEEKSDPFWKRLELSLKENLRKIVVIQYNENPYPLLLTPDQHALLNLQLHLLMTQIQLGLFQQNSMIYQASLKSLQSTLNRYFAVSDEQVKSFLAEINQLMAVNLDYSLPNLQHTLTVSEELLHGLISSPTKAQEPTNLH